MSGSKLDQIVKGAPPPNVSPTQVANTAKSSAAVAPPHHAAPQPQPQPPTTTTPHPPPPDPRDALPSSPPQIYLNLLILESSLRLQYVSLRARLRMHLLLLAALAAWTLTFTYLLFFRPREDGSGVGGSVYWLVETVEKLGWCSGIVTACLFWGTGMYERGVRWPRRFIGTSNRGLRGFNMKLVVVRRGFWGEVAGWLGVLDPAGWLREEQVNFQVLPKDVEAGDGREHWNLQAAKRGLVEEDIAPSGDTLKLLLLPKPFSPDFREGWETYRVEYWDKENARRAELRKIVKQRIRDVAKREGGWLWRTGWRGWHNFRIIQAKSRRQAELEKLALRDTTPVADRFKEKKTHRRESNLRAGSNSRSSSRSSTPAPEAGGHHLRRSSEEGANRSRSATGSRRAKRPHTNAASRLSAAETLPHVEGMSPLTPRSNDGHAANRDDDEYDEIRVRKRDSTTPEVEHESGEA